MSANAAVKINTRCLHYIHLMVNLSLAETLLAKESTEKTMERSGSTVKNYHTNNGRFSDNGFIDSINTKDQKIKFCGVGAYHQNGIIENKNKILTNDA